MMSTGTGRLPVRRSSVQALCYSRREECVIMDAEGHFSISAQALYSRLGTELAPIIVDVRRSPAFESDDTVIIGALRRLPAAVDDWRCELPDGRSVVVYCAHGQEVSQNAATTLRAAGTDACFLEHGIAGWAELGLPRRFIDPEARFLFAPTDRVFAVAAETGATAYDIPGAEPFSHDGELCSF